MKLASRVLGPGVFGLLAVVSCTASSGCMSKDASTNAAPMEAKSLSETTAAASAAPPVPMATTTTPGQMGGARGASIAAKPADGSPREEVGGEDIRAPKLDPNARYATTYRPGGAALAAFDSAVARGSLPANYTDLVGDFGGRYAPPMPKPTETALGFQIDTDREALAPAGGVVNLRIAIRSSDAMPTRAPLSVHLVLDVSGSMRGPAIDNARRAAETLVQKLDPSDDFSMITFSSDAKVLVPDGAIGARRAQVIAKIHEVVADGGTNISAGLDLGYAQAHTPSISPEAVKIVMLLSDGHANAGDANRTSLSERSARAFQDSIQTSSFGLGADFDAGLMSAIADRGAGGYYYLADSTQIASALSHELDARLVPVAQAVEVRVRLRPDVTPLKVFGSHMLDGAEAANVRAQELAVDKQAQKKTGIAQDRQADTEGGMRFFMPAFARDDHHAMLLNVQVPSGTGERSIASVEIRYKDRLHKKNVTEELSVRTRYAPNEAESAKTIRPSVVCTVQAFAAGDAVLGAAELVDHGNRIDAGRILTERAELLRRASESLKEPKLGEDASRLVRLAAAVSGTTRVEDPLPLAVMLRGSGYGYLR
ncbi:MAG: VWA domain-containing protein [Polyangiaceae bacterium]